MIISAAMTVSVDHIALWQRMPRSDSKPVFDRQALKSIRSFASGVMVPPSRHFSSRSLDRIILSKQVSLGVFRLLHNRCPIRAYMTVWRRAILYGPFFPRFVQMITL